MSDRANGGLPPRRTTWVEIASTVLLAFAAVATAWSSYQASRWTGEQAKAFSVAGASGVESTRASSLANARATNYFLGVVLFATSLFFAGISTKLGSPRLKKAVLVIGCTVFLAALAWISTFPISIAI
jgi:hypothetical protein